MANIKKTESYKNRKESKLQSLGVSREVWHISPDVKYSDVS